MPTVFSHAVAAASLIAAFPRKAVPRRLMIAGAICSVIPDLDVIGFGLGIRYGDLWGHRGMSHSILFATIVAAAALMLFGRKLGREGWVFLYLFLATVSHPFLDAFTNGGLGVAFFSPFIETRYFFGHRPIAVSPIGAGFFSQRGLAVMMSELRWVWAPALAFAAISIGIRHWVVAPSQRSGG